MRVAGAIGRGLRFLDAQQLPTGEFVTQACRRPDMSDRAAYEPCVFTTAIVVRALSGVDHPAVSRIRRRALEFFVREMPQPGIWGWATRRRRGDFPMDVDDTACVSASLLRHGVPFPDNRAALLANRTDRGLFLTWFRERTINPFPDRLPIDEQHNVDAAVNAHVLAYLGACDTAPAVVDFVDEAISRGDARAFRYYGHVLAVAYASAHAFTAGVAAMSALRPPIRRALQMSHAGGSYGNPLLDALAVTGAYVFETTDVLPPRLVESLLDAQGAGGGWPRAKMFQRLPEPYYGSAELTTALCVEALQHVQIATASGAHANCA